MSTTGLCENLPGGPNVISGCRAISPGRVVEGAKDAVGGAISDVVSSGFESVVQHIVTGARNLLAEVLTAWTTVPSSTGQSDSVMQSLQKDVVKFTALIAVLSLVAAAMRVAWTRRGDGVPDVLAGLFRMVVVGAAGITVMQVALAAGDAFTMVILEESTDAWAESPPGLLEMDPEIGLGVMLVLGLLGIITGLIQIAFLMVRSAMVVILAGVWQASAAASITQAGAQTWKRVTGWLIALVLYKPGAAICYAAGFKLMTAGNTEGGTSSLILQVEGMMLLILAVLALPAMLRLIVPAAAGMGGPSTGAAIAAGAGVVATGAAVMSGGGFGGGGGGGGAKSSGPSGSTNGGGQGDGMPSGNDSAKGSGGDSPGHPGGAKPSGGPNGGAGDGPAGAPGDQSAGTDGSSGTPTGAGPSGATDSTGADSTGTSEVGGGAGASGASGGSPTAAAAGAAGAASGAAGSVIPQSEDHDDDNSY